MFGKNIQIRAIKACVWSVAFVSAYKDVAGSADSEKNKVERIRRCVIVANKAVDAVTIADVEGLGIPEF